MDTFWYSAIAMIVLALGFLLPPLLRRPSQSNTDGTSAEIAVFRERQKELQEDLQRGTLDSSAYQAAEHELQSAVLEASQHFHSDAATVKPHRYTALLLIILVPSLTIALYQFLGSHDLVVTVAQKEAELQQQSAELRTGVERLQAQLAKHPEDKKMWHMLGRAQLELKDYSKAYIALNKAEALDANDVEILLDKVLALAGMQDPSNAAEQMGLLDRVLRTDPKSQRGLWIASLVALEQQRNDLARDYLQRLLALLPADNKNAELIRRQLAALEQQGGEAPAPASAAGKDSIENPQINVNVKIDPAVATKLAADDTVFVFARAKAGPKMPLAVERIQVKDIPTTIVLNDQKAMAPELRLGNFTDFTVGARISRSGKPEGGPGDFQGFAKEAIHLSTQANTATVEVVIGTPTR